MKKFVVVVLVLVGCGDDSSSTTPDASPDAAIDSAPLCGGAGAVTVVGPPLEPDLVVTTKILSHDENGTLCGMVDGTAGSDARTMIDVPPSGMVTMYIENEGLHGLYTWTAVQPGDELWVPVLQERGVTAKMVAVEFQVPARAGVSSYDVYVQCEHGGGDSRVAAPLGGFTASIECPSTATAVVAMVEADNGTSSEWALSAVTPIAANGATTLVLGAYAPAATPSITVHGTAGFDLAFGSYATSVSPDYYSITVGVSANVSGDPMTLGPVAVPATWGNVMGAGVVQAAEPGYSLRIARRQATPMPLDVTVETDLPPLLSAQLDTGLPRPSITWSTARPTTADAVYINAGKWLIVTRAEPGTVRFPEVPAELLPSEPAHVQAVILLDAKSFNGFDDLRKDPVRAYLDREYSLSTIGDLAGGIGP